MKKFIVLISIILNVMLLVFSLPKITDMLLSNQVTSQNPVTLDAKPMSRIAILTPVSHPSLEKIEQGFKDTLVRNGTRHYQCDVFNAGGNKTLLRAQAEEIVQKDYDLIFTIATQPSQLIKELCTKKGKKTPLIFGAVEDPVRVGIVKSVQIPGGTMTGVVEHAESEQQIKLLKTLKPELKNVLLVYNQAQGSGLEQQKEEYEKVCTAHGIVLNTVEVLSSSEVYPKLSARIAGADAVLVLKDNTVVSGIDGVIKLCNLHHVTLMTSELESGDKGAALGLGVREEQFGVRGAQLALKVLEEGVEPASLACVDAGACKLVINSKTMSQQGLVISDDLLALLKVVTVI